MHGGCACQHDQQTTPLHSKRATAVAHRSCAFSQSEARTYQDLLKDQHDENSLEHFTTVAIVSIKASCWLDSPAGPARSLGTALWKCSPTPQSGRADATGIRTAQVSTGEVAPFGQPRMYCGAAPSPDGRYLMVAWLERPFSYEVPCGRFPRRTQLWDRCADVRAADTSRGTGLYISLPMCARGCPPLSSVHVLS